MFTCNVVTLHFVISISTFVNIQVLHSTYDTESVPDEVYT